MEVLIVFHTDPWGGEANDSICADASAEHSDSETPANREMADLFIIILNVIYRYIAGIAVIVEPATQLKAAPHRHRHGTDRT
jgi:hypothetical protein